MAGNSQKFARIKLGIKLISDSVFKCIKWYILWSSHGTWNTNESLFQEMKAILRYVDITLPQPLNNFNFCDYLIANLNCSLSYFKLK